MNLHLEGTNFNKPLFTFLYIYRHFYEIVNNIYKQTNKINKTSEHNFWEHARVFTVCAMTHTITRVFNIYFLGAVWQWHLVASYGRILSTRAVSCQIVQNNALSRPIYRKIFGTTISTALILLSLFSVFEISTIIRTISNVRHWPVRALVEST